MKHLYTALLLVLSWSVCIHPQETFAQSKTATQPQTLVFKLKPDNASTSSARSASTQVQQLLKQVKVQEVRQVFPRHTVSAASQRTSARKTVDLSHIYALKYEAGQSFAQIKKNLLLSGLVEYVEPLYQHQPLYVPNDPKADSTTGSQKYLKRIMAYPAWDLTQGDTSMVIGILDTGIRLTHEDLKGSIKYNYNDPIDGIDNDGDGLVDNFYGWDFADDDNDPTAINGHGTAVSGFAAAEADNGKGIAGIGFKCKILPLKVFSSGEGNFGGYEAIVYAADHGCKIINLSWGSENTYSAYEQDIINYAVLNKDALVVAAAGNVGKEVKYYPAAYQNVLSVAGINQNDTQGNLTYNYDIDICAPGVDVYTTSNTNNSNYNTGSGSSYAAPMVAGAAALVRTLYPSLTALQVAERLRVTADDIYQLSANTAYQEKLGKGRLNVYRALSEENPRSVRASEWQIDNFLSPGATATLRATFTNYLSPVNALEVTLTSTSPYAQVVQEQVTFGSLPTLATSSVFPFQLKVAENTPANTIISLRFGFSDGDYTDYQHISVVLNPTYITTNINNLMASFLSEGNIGYDGLDYSIGESVMYKKSDPILSEGGLLIGSSPAQVSDNIRNENGTTDYDFHSVVNLQLKANDPQAPFVAEGMFEDSVNSPNQVGVQVKQTILAWSDAPNQDFVITEYAITNRSPQALTDAYAGIFTDWDIFRANQNRTEWAADLQLGYTYHVADSSLFIGVQLLTQGTPGYSAFENTSPQDGTINISDGFTTAEKYQALSGGVPRTGAGDETGLDVSSIVSSKLKNLAHGEEDVVAFALVAGDSRESLKANAAAALLKYQKLVQDRLVTGIGEEPTSTSLSIYPNPTSGKLSVILPSVQQATIEVRTITGQLLQRQTRAGTQELQLDLSSQAAGIYLLKLQTAAGTSTHKIILRK